MPGHFIPSSIIVLPYMSSLMHHYMEVVQYGSMIKWCVLGFICSLNLTSLGFGDNSAYQNVAEFLVAVMGVIGALKLFSKWIKDTLLLLTFL